MEPENSKERKSLFLKMLSFFIGGIIIAVIPIYFTLRLPGIESKVTSKELKSTNEEILYQKDYFAIKMDSVKNMLDMYASPKVDKDKLNADIGSLLSEMEKSIKDTTWRADMNKNIIATYLALKKVHNQNIILNKKLYETKKDLAKSEKEKASLSKSKKKDDSLDPL